MLKIFLALLGAYLAARYVKNIWIAVPTAIVAALASNIVVSIIIAQILPSDDFEAAIYSMIAGVVWYPIISCIAFLIFRRRLKNTTNTTAIIKKYNSRYSSTTSPCKPVRNETTESYQYLGRYITSANKPFRKETPLKSAVQTSIGDGDKIPKKSTIINHIHAEDFNVEAVEDKTTGNKTNRIAENHRDESECTEHRNSVKKLPRLEVTFSESEPREAEANRCDLDKMYEKALFEFDQNTMKKSLEARAVVASKGDKHKERAEYVRLRVKDLLEEEGAVLAEKS